MIHQPIHLFGVVAYGLLSLIAFGFSLAQFIGRKAGPKIARWLLLCIGISQGFYADDEWRWATQ